MAHVKGHINVPAQETKKNEVEKSFFESFKEKTGIDLSTGDFRYKMGKNVKLFKKGGKVSKQKWRKNLNPMQNMNELQRVVRLEEDQILAP